MSIMKDLKHYFADNTKGCDTSTVETKEVTRGSANDNAIGENASLGTTTNSRKKRGRVKIKISQTNTRGRICDIVECKSDLVDKTPSPFGTREHKDEFTESETPKRTKKKNTPKIIVSEQVAISTITEKSRKKNDNSGDENDNLIMNTNRKSVESGACSNGKEIECTENSAMESVKMEREESNAFQVLMTRKKSVQYRAPLTPQDIETAAKIAEESKIKCKSNKEKLIMLADKKGYTKRKLNEIEEAEKIEKRLEKRAKVFRLNRKKDAEGKADTERIKDTEGKKDAEGKEDMKGKKDAEAKKVTEGKNDTEGKKDTENKNSLVGSKRVSPGNLHNYFSRSTVEQKEKELTVVSSIVVEAEVHVSDSQILGHVGKTSRAKIVRNSREADTKESLAKIDHIQRAESPNSQATNDESQPSERRNKKPRWSLRINLHPNNCDSQTDSIVENGDSGVKSESRTRRSRVKTPNYEENDSSEPEASSIKKLKKKKLSAKLQNPKISSNPEILSSETSIKVSTAIAPSVKIIDEIEIIEMKIDKPAGKLAPLFVKRQKPDPAVIEARRAFLHSVPASNETRTIETKPPIVGLPMLPFPTISHVTQLETETKIENSSYKSIFRFREPQMYIHNYDPRELKSVTSLNSLSSKKSNDTLVMTKSNVEEVLSEIESRCSDAREIWTRISAKSCHTEETKKSPKRRGKKRKSTDKKTINVNSNVDCGAWTQKYRPTITRDIVGNEEAAEKFRAWLNGWKINRPRKDSSSGDEFYSSDCSFVSNNDNNQVAVLLGPHGSGKTASVYAIAEELGYSVIEVNASSKRAGKRILKELEEATKSHRIKGHDFPLLKTMTKENEKILPQNSLILVEDVDLVFDEDEGFISATCQLASNTKRPIVMTGRDLCSHLNKMAPQQIRIYYQSTYGLRVSALLELITLAETGYRLPRTCLDRLLQNGDLRKALLQLQYLLMSGKPGASQVPTNFHQTLWQDMRRCVYKPAIRGTKKSTKKKHQNSEKSLINEEKTIIDGLANDLDKLSFLSTMINIDDPAIEISSIKLEPSLSLDENTQDYSCTRLTSFEIAEWLRDRIMTNYDDTCDCNDLQNFRQLTLKKELGVGVNLALSQVSPRTLDHRVTMLDYLASIRAICRAEERRTTTSNKRGNRFFHYLQNLRLPALSTRPSILAAACKIMREKNSDS